MDILSNRNNSENNENNNQVPPPPPYATVIYKTDETIPSPDYSDIDPQSIVYVNNYPGPPLVDGQVQGIQTLPTNIPETRRSKNVRSYLLINGIIMIIFGTITIGIQIGGAIIISFGIGSILFYRLRMQLIPMFPNVF